MWLQQIIGWNLLYRLSDSRNSHIGNSTWRPVAPEPRNFHVVRVVNLRCVSWADRSNVPVGLPVWPFQFLSFFWENQPSKIWRMVYRTKNCGFARVVRVRHFVSPLTCACVANVAWIGWLIFPTPKVIMNLRYSLQVWYAAFSLHQFLLVH